MEYRAVEIDHDVHKRIEAERRSFLETPNDALRRLLKIEGTSELREPQVGRSWSGRGVSLPHGTKIKMTYNGQTHLGEIIDGSWLVGGQSYNNPSPAAGAVARTKRGTSTSLSGFREWSVRRPNDGEWIRLSSLKPAKPSTKLDIAKIAEAF